MLVQKCCLKGLSFSLPAKRDIFTSENLERPIHPKWALEVSVLRLGGMGRRLSRKLGVESALSPHHLVSDISIVYLPPPIPELLSHLKFNFDLWGSEE